MTTTLQPGRSTATGVTFSLGLMRLQADLLSTTRSGKSTDGAMRLACPHDHLDGEGKPLGPSTVTQQYICDHDPRSAAIDDALRRLATADDATRSEVLVDLADALQEPGHGPYSVADLSRGRHTDDGRFVLADRGELVAAKVGSLEKEQIALAVHPAGEIDSICLPGEKVYLVRPSKGKSKKITAADEEAYAALKVLATQEDLALVGSLRLRDSRSVFRLSMWGDQVVLRELTLPSDLKERDVIDPAPLSERIATDLVELARSNMRPFDEDEHRWDVEAAVAELVERAAADDSAPEAAPVFNEHSLDELLQMAIAARKDSTTAA